MTGALVVVIKNLMTGGDPVILKTQLRYGATAWISGCHVGWHLSPSVVEMVVAVGPTVAVFESLNLEIARETLIFSSQRDFGPGVEKFE
jgi:uncharacterized phosphosugar-binding protein